MNESIKANFSYEAPKLDASYLKYFPHLLLWVVAPFWLLILRNMQKIFIINISITFVIKIISILALIGLEISHMALMGLNQSSLVLDKHVIYPVISSISFAIAIFVIWYERIRGIPSSVPIFAFFGLICLLNLEPIYNHLFRTDHHNRENIDFNEIKMWAHTFLCWETFFLTWFANNHTTSRQRRKEKYIPIAEVSPWSKLTFWWMTGIIFEAFRRDLTEDDLWKLDKEILSECEAPKLEREWNKVATKYLNKKRELDSLKLQNGCTEEENVKFIQPKANENKQQLRKPSLLLCLFKAFYGKYLISVSLKLTRDMILFISPLILGKLIDYIKDTENNSLIIGLFYSFSLFMMSQFHSMVFHQYFDYVFSMTARFRLSLVHLIYKKSLVLSNMARKESTLGEMVNVMSVNVQSLHEFCHHVNMTGSCIISILVGTFFLQLQLGLVASLGGLLIMIIILPFNAYASNLCKKIQVKKLKHTDSRVKTINEMLNGIKVIKLYAWEIPFKKLIEKCRISELSYLRHIGYFMIIPNISWVFTPFLVTVVSLGIYSFISADNVLNPKSAFVSFAIFNVLRQPLAMLPINVSNLIQSRVAFYRIVNFLLKEELSSDDITHIENEDSKEYPIQIENGNFGWDHSEAFLQDINIKVKKGTLFAVVGKVGNGKSSLLSALIGEMYKFSGNVNVTGRIAYAPQQAWVQNTTLRENILFGRAYDETLYKRVIEACALDLDLRLLPAGDATEIGEKGINLSGGQKQRISLARCLYSDADLYFLDDSLSAVDAHVAAHIFNGTLGPNGFLKDKTRVLVTNSLNFLPQVDCLILVENGKIVDSGPFENLLNSNGPFSDFYKTFLSIKEATIETTKNLTENQTEENEKKEETLKDVKKNGIVTEKFSKGQNEAGKKLIEKETVQTGNVKKSVYLEYLKACGYWSFFFYIIINLIGTGFSIWSSFWLSEWSDKQVTDSNDKIYYFGVFLALGFINCIFMLIGDFIFTEMFVRAAKNSHEDLLYSIVRCTMQFFESTPIGRILNRFSKDIDAIESRIPEFLRMFIRSALNVLSVVVVISVTQPFFLLAFIPITAGYILIQRLYSGFARQAKRMESVSRSPIYAFFAESINGISTIRAFGSQQRYVRRMQDYCDANIRIFYSDMYANRWVGLRLEIVGSFVILFASLVAVFKKHQISAGIAGLSISYAISITQSLLWTVRAFSEFEAFLTSIERVREYCDLPHEAEWEIEKTKPDESWPSKGEIEFKDYSVKYRTELDFALKDISFSIKSGEKIGIVGRTGAGKSSLTLGLFRILESSFGSIVIDDRNISEIGLHDLRKKLTIIPQDPFLFGATLRVNLDPFGFYTDDEIWSALEQTHLKEFVMASERKLDFECCEGGENLSVGQRQLICLARALLKKTKILILDEATAAIDAQTDELVQATIKEEFSDCTVLTIAHRLNTTLNSDRIMVLDKGRIVEFDSPKALLADPTSIFHSMAVSAGII